MIITDDAKEILKKALAENKCDCLQATLKQAGCGKSVSFSLSNLMNDDKAQIINGIPVLMDEEILKKVEQVTLYTEDGELLFHDDAPSSCSSCSSCS